MNKVRVLIVDDQTLIRQGIRMLLSTEEDIEVVGEAATGREAVALAAHLLPDAVLMDVRMPEMDGITATRELRARLPQCGVIILTTFDDDETIFDGLRAGARGYLLKDISSEEMAEAIRTVAAGKALIQPSVTRKVLEEFARLSQPPPGHKLVQAVSEPLTERELEVLGAIAGGLSNKEISERLYITEGTVKNHVSNLIAKLEVRDRTQAVLKGKELGLV